MKFHHNKVPLCSDAFSRWIEGDPQRDVHNKEVTEATNYLYEHVIPAFAEKLNAEKINEELFFQYMHKFEISMNFLMK